MRIVSLIFMLMTALTATAQNNINIVPMPAEVKMGKGIFNLNRNTVIVLEGSGMERSTAFFNEQLQKRYGYKLKVVKDHGGTNSIRLNYERLDNDLPGAYNLTVDKNGIYIAGDNEEGVFYGIQSLLQLIPSTTNHQPATINSKQLPVPFLTINDYPRFSYRGMHLDVCRHIFPVDFIKKYIDYLAMNKMNTFHWHLTDDQGWRIAIKKYPLLTQVGSCRAQTLVGNYGTDKYDGTPYCGFYTQAQVKEIVQYAADRYISVIPEIEMPGHAVAALTSYPYLGCTKGPYKTYETWGVSDDVFCAGNDSTYTFLQNVLDEVMQLFPSKYIHIGGDECPKERWKTCPVCQKRMKEQGLKNENGLQSYFTKRIEKYINSKGRKIIGWDEILEGGIAPNATIMSWRGEEGGIEAARQNHDVIMTPGSHCYLDHSQSKNEDSLTIGGYLPLEKVYSYEPIPAGLTAAQAKHILGAQGNVWTEYITNPSKVEYMIFPRMMALSEVLWTPAKKRDWKDFERRLPVIFSRLDEQKINYSKAYYDLKATVIPTENFTGVLWKLESKNKEHEIRYQFPEGNSPDFKYDQPILVSSNTIYTAYAKNSDGSSSNPVYQSFHINKATGKKISIKNQPHVNYPGNGAFTLVDGVQNEKGLTRSNEFLGFLGTDLDAIIDLGTATDISKVTLHVLGLNGSWIYLPASIEINYLPDVDITEDIFNKAPKANLIVDTKKEGTTIISIEKKANCRYLHILVKNYGSIPSGQPGAGNPAWLFADEIEVE